MIAPPLQAVKFDCNKAKEYIMKNCNWSKTTYYRKMSDYKTLTETQKEVIVAAYIQFIHEPLLRTLQTNLPLSKAV